MNNYLIAFKDSTLVVSQPADRGEEDENSLRLYVGDEVVFFVHLADILYVLRQNKLTVDDHTNIDELLSDSPILPKVNYCSVNGRNPGEGKKHPIRKKIEMDPCTHSESFEEEFNPSFVQFRAMDIKEILSQLPSDVCDKRRELIVADMKKYIPEKYYDKVIFSEREWPTGITSLRWEYNPDCVKYRQSKEE